MSTSEKPLFLFLQGKSVDGWPSQIEHNKIFSVGYANFIAADNYHRWLEIIQSGELGKIKTVRLWKTGEPPLIQVSHLSGTAP